TPIIFPRGSGISRGLMGAVKAIRLRSLRDLVHVLSVSQIPLVHHIGLDGLHVYFVPIALSSDSSVIYFYASQTPLEGGFLLFNNFTGEVTVSERWVSDSKHIVIPIVEVDGQNIFSEKILLKELLKTERKEQARQAQDERENREGRSLVPAEARR
ncbi:MAG: hypothetical protein QXJ99_02490, partial [Thermofilum sp.]